MICKKLHLNLSLSGQAYIVFVDSASSSSLLYSFPKSVHGQGAHRNSCRNYVKDEVVDYECEVLVML